jgi:kynurenine formamidase
MKIDLSVAITEEILNTLFNLNATGQIPPVAKFGHIGTHFDVMDKEFQLENTERKGTLFDVSHVKGRDIEITDIDTAKIAENDFVIFHTGCLKERKYGSPGYFTSHPELANALITYLVNKKVSMIGIDAAGIRNSAEHPKADQYCADNGIFVIENLDNLDLLLKETRTHEFIVHTYPVKYQGLTGLPCRVVAEISCSTCAI